jgi:hypothetical protein
MEENTTPKHPVLMALTTKFAEENKVLSDKIVELEAKLEKQIQAQSTKFYEQLANEEKLKEILVEAINDSEITNEFAKSIADIFDIELTEEVEMELTFKVQATFTVPIGFDTDSLASDFGITENPLGVAEEYLDNSYWELDDWNITS